MKRREFLHFGSVFVLVCAILVSLWYVRSATAHWDKRYSKMVVETCYLIGYPSRTKCGVNRFKEVTDRSTNAHHNFVVVGGNHIAIVHKPGHANHERKEYPSSAHVNRTKNVY